MALITVNLERKICTTPIQVNPYFTASCLVYHVIVKFPNQVNYIQLHFFSLMQLSPRFTPRQKPKSQNFFFSIPQQKHHHHNNLNLNFSQHFSHTWSPPSCEMSVLMFLNHDSTTTSSQSFTTTFSNITKCVTKLKRHFLHCF